MTVVINQGVDNERQVEAATNVAVRDGQLLLQRTIGNGKSVTITTAIPERWATAEVLQEAKA